MWPEFFPQIRDVGYFMFRAITIYWLKTYKPIENMAEDQL